VRLLTWLPDGKMEVVPLYEFVYHEYGPVAMQGVYSADPWRTPAGDDFWTWAEARATLWGGLLVLIPVSDDLEVPEPRARFLRSMAAARTGFARDFLAYGRMQRAPRVRCDKLRVNHGLAEGGWLRTLLFPKTSNASEAAPSPADQGGAGPTVEEWVASLATFPSTAAQTDTMSVPQVTAQAYTFGNRRLGIVLVNLAAEGQVEVDVPVDPVGCGLPPGRYRAARVTVDGREQLRSFEDRATLRVSIPAREVVLVEASR